MKKKCLLILPKNYEFVHYKLVVQIYRLQVEVWGYKIERMGNRRDFQVQAL
jgi:hypothetical protein